MDMSWAEGVLRSISPDLGAQVKSVQQTQTDVNRIAALSNQLQSQPFQQQLNDVRTGVEIYASAQLTMQLISTAAMVGMLYISYLNYKKGR